MEDKEATYAADVFHTILSLESSRLNQKLVESGLAFQVGTSYQTLKHVGPITIFLVPNPQNMDAAIKTLEEEIQAWDDPDYFSDEQMEAAKNQLVIQDIYSRESTSDFVHSLTYWWASADLDYYLNYIDNLKEVSRDDIQEYVREYIQGKPNVTGLLLSPSMKETMKIENFEPISM
jgi:zinc protease